MKRILFVLLSAVCMVANAATLVPIQLLNPAGSTSGQAVVSTGASSAPTWGNVTAGSLVAQAANTIVANGTGSLASPAAIAVPSCNTSSSALNWTTSGGSSAITCNTSINAATLGGNSVGTSGSTVPLLNGSNTWSGAQTFSALITPASAIGIKGTTTNDSPAAGSIGENPTNTTNATSMTNNTGANCTSLSLTAGNWRVGGVVTFLPSAAPAQIVAGVSATSGTLGAIGTFQTLQATFTSGASQSLSAPDQFLKLSSTTTVYLIGQSNFASGTLTCNGTIFALRIR